MELPNSAFFCPPAVIRRLVNNRPISSEAVKQNLDFFFQKNPPRPNSGGRGLLYAPEMNYFTVVDPEGFRARKAEIFGELLAQLPEIRWKVAECLGDLGWEVLLSEQSSEILVASASRRSTSWAPLVGDSTRVFKLSGVRGHTPVDIPDHIHLIPEITRSAVGIMAPGNMDPLVLSAAPNIPDGIPLHKYRSETIQERVQLLRDGMKGCVELHRMGLVHCDIKPSQILVVEVNGRKIGKLFDFEGVARSGSPTPPPVCTDFYNEAIYYSRNSRSTIDPSRDVFSFGVSLYELYYDEYYKDEVLIGLSDILQRNVGCTDLGAEKCRLFLRSYFSDRQAANFSRFIGEYGVNAGLKELSRSLGKKFLKNHFLMDLLQREPPIKSKLFDLFPTQVSELILQMTSANPMARPTLTSVIDKLSE